MARPHLKYQPENINLMKFPFFSKTILGLSIYMVFSASFNRQIMELCMGMVGKRGFYNFVAWGLMVASIIIFILLAKNIHNPFNFAIAILLLLIASVMVWKIKLPQERIHIFQYSGFSWLCLYDLIKRFRSKILPLVFQGWLFAMIIGALEEGFQRILPYRVFEWRDMSFNFIGVTLGVVIFLLCYDNNRKNIIKND